MILYKLTDNEIYEIFKLYSGKFWNNQQVKTIIPGYYYIKIYGNYTLDYRAGNISINNLNETEEKRIISTYINNPDGPSIIENAIEEVITFC